MVPEETDRLDLERHNIIISLLSLRASLQPWVLCGYLDLNCDRGMNQKSVFGARALGWGVVRDCLLAHWAYRFVRKHEGEWCLHGG